MSDTGLKKLILSESERAWLPEVEQLKGRLAISEEARAGALRENSRLQSHHTALLSAATELLAAFDELAKTKGGVEAAIWAMALERFRHLVSPKPPHLDTTPNPPHPAEKGSDESGT